MSYSIETLTDDCYPGTNCLINKFNIQKYLFRRGILQGNSERTEGLPGEMHRPMQ